MAKHFQLTDCYPIEYSDDTKRATFTMTKFTNEELLSHKNANAEIRGNYTKCAKELYREKGKGCQEIGGEQEKGGKGGGLKERGGQGRGDE